MPTLDWALLADHAIVDSDTNSVHLHSAGVAVRGAPQFPAGFPLAVVLSLDMTAAEVHRPHHLEIIGMTADGQQIFKVDGTIANSEAPRDGQVGEPSNIKIAHQLIFPAPAPGRYSVVIMVDDQEKKALPLQVVEMELRDGP